MLRKLYKNRRRHLPIAIGIVGLAIAVGLSVYFCSGWSKLNCWTWELDINSGQKRYTRYWFWLRTAERIEPTWVSQALGSNRTDSDRRWQRIATLSPGTGYSPHYQLVAALAYVDYFTYWTDQGLMEKDAAAMMARNIITLWQAFNDDGVANDYIAAVLGIAQQEGKLTTQDIPDLEQWVESQLKQYRRSHPPPVGLEWFEQAVEEIRLKSRIPPSAND